MLRFVFTSIGVVAVVLVIVGGAVKARAEPLAPGARPVTVQERLLLREQWVRSREYERAQIRIGAPLTGLVLGAAILATCAWAATIEESRKPALGIAIVVGLPVTALSAVILAKRVRKRRSIARELWNHAASGQRGFSF